MSNRRIIGVTTGLIRGLSILCILVSPLVFSVGYNWLLPVIYGYVHAALAMPVIIVVGLGTIVIGAIMIGKGLTFQIKTRSLSGGNSQ